MKRALLALAPLVLLTGCGTTNIDHTRLETQIHDWAVNKQQADPSVKVECPSGVPVKPGSTFNCILSAGKQTARLTVTIENNDGDVTWAVG